MSLWLVASEYRMARARMNACNIFINVVEQELSRFRPDSGLSRLNARSGQPVKVSPLVWQVLLSALDAARATNGLYDPTILNALISAGYSSSFETLGHQQSSRCRPTPQQASWEDIQLNQENLTVTLPEGTGIDLGGITKGWVAGQVAQSLSAIGPCLVDLGGDIAAIGNPPETEGWPVGVADPLRPDLNLGVLSIRDRGVATSGVDYRRWHAGGEPRHHVIDPRTGGPAHTDLLTVTVVAPDAIQADVYAKTALILGSEAGWKLLTNLSSVAGILVLQNGSNAISPGLGDYLIDDSTQVGNA